MKHDYKQKRHSNTMPTPYIIVTIIEAVVIAALAIFLIKKLKSDSSQSKNSSINLIDAVTVLNAINDGVCVVDDNDNIKLLNPSAQQTTGWSQEEAMGLSYKTIFSLQDEAGNVLEGAKSLLSKAKAKNAPIHDEKIQLITRSKNTVQIDITITPIEDEGRCMYIVIFRDITTRVKTEQERGDFISTASHEMRTPVASIEGYLSLALNKKVCVIDDKAREFIEKAHESSEHLGRLFQDLLSSSQADDGRLQYNPVIVNVGDFIEKLIDNSQILVKDKGIKISLQNNTKKPENSIQPLYYVNIDPDKLTEALNNLLNNAIKYTNTGGRITIGITADSTNVQISVEDTGIGIQPEYTSHIFQKFYRVDNSSTRTIGGTGLGLYITKKIVELANGSIWVESEPGKGTKFFISLPKATKKDSKPATNVVKPTSTAK